MNTPNFPHAAGGPGSRQRGLTLVEWMVSIAIGSFVLIALLALVAQQSYTQAELDRSSRQIENGRYATEVLTSDLQLAGYYGVYGKVSSLAVPTALPNPCTTTEADLAAALPFAVQGYDAPTTLNVDLATCLNALNHVDGTDILVVRHAEPTEVLSTALVVGQVYLQTGLTAALDEVSFTLKKAADNPLNPVTFPLLKKDGVTAASMRRYLVHIYFVSPCSVPKAGTTCSTDNTDDGGFSIPTLKRLELTVSGGAPVFTVTPLVEGVENLQIDYGIDTTGDGIPDGAYVKSPAAVADWANVMAARIHILARNTERSAGHTDTATYDLGLADNVGPFNDTIKRREFSQMVRLVNPAARRDM